MKALIVFLLCCSTLAVAKSREWQDAVVYKMESSSGNLIVAPVGSGIIAGRVTWLHYFVETSTLKAELVTNRNLNITINKRTSVAFDGQNAFLRDDDGKEKKLRIIQKVAKQSSN